MLRTLSASSGQFGDERRGGPAITGFAEASRRACAFFPIGGQVYNGHALALRISRAFPQKTLVVRRERRTLPAGRGILRQQLEMVAR